MKKLVLTLLLLSFISAIPCFAMKVITNKDLDRTVPSRSFKPGVEINVDEYQETTYTAPTRTSNFINGYRDGWGYKGVTYEKYYRPLIGRDLRPELIGTTWSYPKAQTIVSETPGKKVVKTKSTTYRNQLPKRYIREAADYYMIDTIKDPNHPILAGEAL